MKRNRWNLKLGEYFIAIVTSDEMLLEFCFAAAPIALPYIQWIAQTLDATRIFFDIFQRQQMQWFIALDGGEKITLFAHR